MNDNAKIFAGGLLVALLAIALELLLAVVQRGAHLAGHPLGGKVKVRDLATDRIAADRSRALSPDPSKPDRFAKVSPPRSGVGKSPDADT